jgi:nucleoside-diphosphate-sugar epimerase
MKMVCMTGGSGYITSVLIKMLLEKGYAVKKIVRNPGLILVSLVHISSILRVTSRL